MIIFDLDGTLADCSHRRHFVDKKYAMNRKDLYFQGDFPKTGLFNLNTENNWKPDWKAFYEACGDDKPIQPVIDIFTRCVCTDKVEIWSGRCESVRDKTLLWLDRNLNVNTDEFLLKMRPIGDYTPEDEIKFHWANDTIIKEGKDIEFVFDSDVASIAMWKRRNIFVFDCAQHNEEF